MMFTSIRRKANLFAIAPLVREAQSHVTADPHVLSEATRRDVSMAERPDRESRIAARHLVWLGVASLVKDVCTGPFYARLCLPWGGKLAA